MADTLQITGLAELKKQLEALPAKIEGNVMRGAMRAGLKVILDGARAEAPKRTGALAKSLRIRQDRKSAKFGWVRMSVAVGNAVAWYPHLVEYGTASYYTGSGRSVGAPYEIRPVGKKSLFFAGLARDLTVHPGIRPQPFMRPAFDKYSQPAMDAVVQYLQTRIPKELAKAK